MSRSASIAQQISSIAKTPIYGLLLLSVLAIAATVMLRGIFTDYRYTSQSTLTATAIVEDVFEARLAALKWRMSQSQSEIDAFQENIAELDAAQTETDRLIAEDPVMYAGLAALAREYGQYQKGFATLVAAQEEYKRVEKTLKTAGKRAREILTELAEATYLSRNYEAAYSTGRAQEALLLGRYYLERYRQSKDQTDLDRSVEEMGRSIETLTALRSQLSNADQTSLMDEAVSSLSEFVEDAAILSTKVQESVQAADELDRIGPKLIADVEAVFDATVAHHNTLGPRGDALSLVAMLVIIVGAAVVVLIGWRVSRKMSTRISTDIENAAKAMTQIAQGDLNAPVPHVDGDTELGRMADALEIFKANGKSALAADERQKELEAQHQKDAEAARIQREKQEQEARENAEEARRQMISELSASLGKVVFAGSSGDFSQRVDAHFDDPELVALAENVNTLLGSVEYGIGAISTVLKRVASGDLSTSMQGQFEGAFKELQTSSNQMISGLTNLIGELGESSKNLSASSSELRDTSELLSRQSEQNAASLEETSASLEELNASIRQVSENIADANSHARSASGTAESSGVVASDAAEAMNRIAEASAEITKVVSVINDISFQINLLALNAGVEAARAGEAGRGFSVVASEVRQLSQRASEAAQEISDVIAKSDSAVAEGVSKVAAAQDALSQISQSVIGVSSRIDEISTSISEQVNGVTEINVAISQIDQNTQKQAASFEEVSAASALLSTEAVSLQKATGRFRTSADANQATQAENAPASPPAGPKSSTKSYASAGNLALEDDDWEDF